MRDKPRVLLLGNGINRAYNFASWGELITSMQKRRFTDEEEYVLDGMSYPLRAVAMTDDNVDSAMSDISEQMSVLFPPEEEMVILENLSKLPVDAILTTNYTYEIEKSLAEDFACAPGRKCKYRQCKKPSVGEYERNQLYTYFQMSDNSPEVWHIHGEAARHKTMVIGHYYYGKLIAKMQKHIGDSMRIYKAYSQGKCELGWHSWIDYFMLGDVTIVGLGLDLSEMDLWWLISCKKLHFPDTGVTLYKPDVKMTEKILCEAYRVTVIEDGLNDRDYKKYYQWVLEELTQKYQNKGGITTEG